MRIYNCNYTATGDERNSFFSLSEIDILTCFPFDGMQAGPEVFGTIYLYFLHVFQMRRCMTLETSEHAHNARHFNKVLNHFIEICVQIHQNIMW